MKLGSINCYSISEAKFGNKKFVFDGTTLGLVKSALAVGAKVGDIIQANYGAGFKPMKLYSNPIDDRVNGIWAK